MNQFEDPREIKVGVGKSFLSVENRIYFGTGFFSRRKRRKSKQQKKKYFKLNFVGKWKEKREGSKETIFVETFLFLFMLTLDLV